MKEAGRLFLDGVLSGEDPVPTAAGSEVSSDTAEWDKDGSKGCEVWGRKMTATDCVPLPWRTSTRRITTRSIKGPEREIRGKKSPLKRGKGESET